MDIPIWLAAIMVTAGFGLSASAWGYVVKHVQNNEAQLALVSARLAAIEQTCKGRKDFSQGLTLWVGKVEGKVDKLMYSNASAHTELVKALGRIEGQLSRGGRR